jgi:alpha-glucosidase
MPGQWWEGGALYQIYVRSFADTDGDGHGDLPGVIGKLDYLEWLGVDGIWLSPTMPSPADDWGYDVADYRAVHPQLGTMADLDRLVAEAGRRGIRVLLDLVPNHTSAAHPWFRAALADRAAPARGYYVWADPRPKGGPPNNWRDATGGPAWTLDGRSGQYYLHNFLPSQPDLNWWNPAVHREFREVLSFWSGRGIAGFRIDVAHGLYHDDQLRDNPPAGPDAPPMLRRQGLLPVYSSGRPEVHGVYRQWRQLAERYDPPRLLLGETWVYPVEAMARYYGDGDELQLAVNFPFLFSRFTAPGLAAAVRQTLAALPPGACPLWTGSNHDVPRLVTRWAAGDERRARLALLILATLPGTVLLYYGDEIGMADTEVPPGLRRDAMTRDAPPDGRVRDRARTPMQWSGEPGAGFCPPEVTPWLPFGDYQRVNVADQRGRRGSVLTLARDLLSLRRQRRAGRAADYEEIAVTGGHWCYRSGSVLVLANFSGQPARLPAPAGEVLAATGTPPSRSGGRLALGPWEGAVLAADGPAGP